MKHLLTRLSALLLCAVLMCATLPCAHAELDELAYFEPNLLDTLGLTTADWLKNDSYRAALATLMMFDLTLADIPDVHINIMTEAMGNNTVYVALHDTILLGYFMSDSYLLSVYYTPGTGVAAYDVSSFHNASGSADIILTTFKSEDIFSVYYQVDPQEMLDLMNALLNE